MHPIARLVTSLLLPPTLAIACTVAPNPVPNGTTSSSSSASASSGSSGTAGAGGVTGAGGMAGAGGSAGVAGTGGSGGSMANAPKPEFALLDVNPSSATSGKTISPRDYIGQISAWYFGHST